MADTETDTLEFRRYGAGDPSLPILISVVGDTEADVQEGIEILIEELEGTHHYTLGGLSERGGLRQRFAQCFYAVRKDTRIRSLAYDPKAA